MKKPETSLSASMFKLYRRIERRITPGLRYCQDVYKDVLTRHVPRSTRWLDLGCGHTVLPPWHRADEEQLLTRCRQVVGLDRSLPSLRKHRTISRLVSGDIARLPFPDNAFDLVTANMVVEHLADPFGQFSEIRRVLVPAGVFVCHTPNVLAYTTALARLLPEPVKRVLIRLLERRTAADVFKTYYRANSRRRLTRIAEQSGLQVLDLRMVLSSAQCAVITPIAILELLWIRALMSPRLRAFRPTIIGTFTKPIPAADETRP